MSERDLRAERKKKLAEGMRRLDGEKVAEATAGMDRWELVSAIQAFGVQRGLVRALEEIEHPTSRGDTANSLRILLAIVRPLVRKDRRPPRPNGG